jgi:hypothetical protein
VFTWKSLIRGKSVLRWYRSTNSRSLVRQNPSGSRALTRSTGDTVAVYFAAVLLAAPFLLTSSSRSRIGTRLLTPPSLRTLHGRAPSDAAQQGRSHSVDASMLCQHLGWEAGRRAACSAASPASRVAAQSLCDGRWPRLAPEPRRPGWAGVGRPGPAPAVHGVPPARVRAGAGQAAGAGVGCAAVRTRKIWRAM